MELTRVFRNRKGFTYYELMAGMSIFLLGISFFTVLYRFSANNKIVAGELTAMATAAQNMAEVYIAFAGTPEDSVNAAKIEGQSEGFSADNIVFLPPEQLSTDKHDYNYHIYKITVTIHPRIDKPDINDYVFSFYYIDKDNLYIQ